MAKLVRVLEHADDPNPTQLRIYHSLISVWDIRAYLKNHTAAEAVEMLDVLAEKDHNFDSDILRALVADHVAHACAAETLLGDDDATPYRVPTAICQSTRLTSDVGHALLDAYPDAPFVAVETLYAGGLVRVGLHSEDHRADVLEIARERGGIGHHNAARFAVKL